MLHFYIGGALFRVRFHHYDVNDPRALWKKTTVAYIHEGFTERAAYTGVAHCSKDDNFCREAGRKWALRRALASWPRSVRKEFWEAYHKRGRGRAERALPVRVLPPGPSFGVEVVL